MRASVRRSSSCSPQLSAPPPLPPPPGAVKGQPRKRSGREPARDLPPTHAAQVGPSISVDVPQCQLPAAGPRPCPAAPAPPPKPVGARGKLRAGREGAGDALRLCEAEVGATIAVQVAEVGRRV